ncbi:MAG: hypothetical protein N4A62_09835 [Marinisporobacter sp.]|jgi:hypothetical protein|nr:hypothetical protein [Marinisporobacter sp.]
MKLFIYSTFKESIGNLCEYLVDFFEKAKKDESTQKYESIETNKETFIKHLKALYVYLEEGSFKAESAANDLKKLEIGFDLEEKLDEIIDAIEDVEFSYAQQIVNTLIQGLE